MVFYSLQECGFSDTRWWIYICKNQITSLNLILPANSDQSDQPQPDGFVDGLGNGDKVVICNIIFMYGEVF